jgi:hypothetical protein
MREYTTIWNHINDIPSLGDEIKVAFGNGMGTDKRYPYMVESIFKTKRGDFDVHTVEGRQLKVGGSFRNVWFQLLFTNKPTGHIGWTKSEVK